MPAYIIARVEVTSGEQYRRYLDAAPAVIEKFGGRALARSTEPFTLEGPQEKRRIVLLEFPDREKAREFYHSPEYRKARALREKAAVGELILIDGIAPA